VTEPRSIAFVETAVFTRRITTLRLEEPLRELQLALLRNPEAGPLDPGTGGLRKVRIPDPNRGQGKRGGARVHYLWLSGPAVLYFIFVYGKDESPTLTQDQKRQLKALVQAIKAEWAKE
jgi:hypothetical protein